MANDIKVKGSEVASGVPLTGDLVEREIAINLTDKKIYSKTSGGTIVEIANAAGSSVTTKGDLQTYTTTTDRLPVGSDGQILQADSGETTGLKWVGLRPGKNLITNGNFRIWQRATSFIPAVNGAYHTDRWNYNVVGGGASTIQKSTVTPDNLSIDSLHLDVTTADTDVQAGDFAIINQHIEGYLIEHLGSGSSDAKNVTLSFWVRSSKTGIHCVSLKNGTSNRIYPMEYTVDSADTFEYKTQTLTLDTTGTWGTGAGRGITLVFALMAGTNWHGTKDTWQATGDFATSNQVNVFDSTSGNFYLSRVQLEEGTVATPYEFKSHEEELQICQRYYAKTFLIATDPASNVTSDGALLAIGSGNGNFQFNWRFPQTMRASPTITTYNPQASGSDARNTDDGTNESVTVNFKTDSSCQIYATALDSLHQNNMIRIHAVAVAEI